MKKIGGYFGLELCPGTQYHRDAVYLNSGRNAMLFLLQQQNIRQILVPYYICDVVTRQLKKQKIAFEYYSISESLEPVLPSVDPGQAILVVNYFGLLDKPLRPLLAKKKVLVDASQAFFSRNAAQLGSFYSPRKFFGLPDGGIAAGGKFRRVLLPAERDTSFNRFSHLLKRTDLSPEAGYPDFARHEEALGKRPVLRMSQLTEQLLSSFDYTGIRKKRRANYTTLASELQTRNLLQLSLDANAVPLYYPYLAENGGRLRKKLIAEGIFAPSLWNSVPDVAPRNSFETLLAKHLVPLPIDQRYGAAEMEYIVKMVRRHGK